jgi:hypothetical protein
VLGDEIKETACNIVRILMVMKSLVFAANDNVRQRTAMGWTVRGSIPGGGKFSAAVQTRPGAHPASYTMGTGSFPGGKSAAAWR